MEGAERAAALTRRLLGFARAEPENSVPTDAGAVLIDMEQLLDRVIGDTIRVRIDRAADLWPIEVDRHQFENAVLNLAVNARDAMPRGGALVLSTANVSFDAPRSTLTAGDYVRVAVHDTGMGMPPEVVARIFEPFFTTKPLNQGTGLGLSQIYGFMQGVGGAIEVESLEGEGTLVSLIFPRSAGIVARAARASGDPVTAASPKRILVVEDDHRVLASTVAALEELGHRPIPCAEPLGALAAIAKHPDADLVISDVMMPDLTGPEIRVQAAALRPDLPFLFVTGFAEEESRRGIAGCARVAQTLHRLRRWARQSKRRSAQPLSHLTTRDQLRQHDEGGQQRMAALPWLDLDRLPRMPRDLPREIVDTAGKGQAGLGQFGNLTDFAPAAHARPQVTVDRAGYRSLPIPLGNDRDRRRRCCRVAPRVRRAIRWRTSRQSRDANAESNLHRRPG